MSICMPNLLFHRLEKKHVRSAMPMRFFVLGVDAFTVIPKEPVPPRIYPIAKGARDKASSLE
jgi:hypothetical protein